MGKWPITVTRPDNKPIQVQEHEEDVGIFNKKNIKRIVNSLCHYIHPTKCHKNHDLSLFRWRFQKVIGTITLYLDSSNIDYNLLVKHWWKMVLKVVWIFQNCKLRYIKKCMSVDCRGLPQKYWAVGLEGWAMPDSMFEFCRKVISINIWFNIAYSLAYLVMPNTEEQFSQPFLGLSKIWQLFQDPIIV